MYKAILLNCRGEVEDYRICRAYHTAIRQCQEWQLKHEYDFWDTEIINLENVKTITYSEKENRSHEHKLLLKN